MVIKIDKEALEQACKDTIETILLCLPNANKGIVYQIGKPPEMIARVITSGVVNGDRKVISWGLTERSAYNTPGGKPWIEYRDEPGRPPEAMAWCVEKQKSWTEGSHNNDRRSIRLQEEGGCYHMEPVLIHKQDAYHSNESSLEYVRNYEGELLWENSEYVVVAVIKVYFQPNTVEIGSPETNTIERLSRVLGTELLSHQLREQSLEAMRQVAEDKLNSCNILADSLRNAITKSGLIFSLIKLEVAYLREQWEEILLEHSDQRGMKREAVYGLNKALRNMGETPDELIKDLLHKQNKFLGLSLPPERGEHWVDMQIEQTWSKLVCERSLGEEQRKEIHRSIHQLKRSLYLGKDPSILAAYDRVPESLKREWIDLIYRDIDSVDFEFLDRLNHILENPSLNLPYQEKSRKSLIRLKALAEIMGQLEESTNVVLRQVLNGHDYKLISDVLKKKAK